MKLRTKILIVFTALWMLLIFVMSAQSVKISSNASHKITKIIVETLYGNETPRTAEEAGWHGSATTVFEDIESGLVPKNDIFGRNRFNFKNDVRKAAHIFLFFILAVLVNMIFISHFGKNRLIYALISFGFCVCYGVLDEFHQYFVPGRSMNLKDVLIDSAGVLAGVVVVACLCAVIKLFKRLIIKTNKTA